MKEITLEMYILQLLHLKALRATTAQDSIGTLEKMKDQKQEILQEEKILNDNNNLKIKSHLKYRPSKNISSRGTKTKR